MADTKRACIVNYAGSFSIMMSWNYSFTISFTTFIICSTFGLLK